MCLGHLHLLYHRIGTRRSTKWGSERDLPEKRIATESIHTVKLRSRLCKSMTLCVTKLVIRCMILHRLAIMGLSTCVIMEMFEK